MKYRYGNIPVTYEPLGWDVSAYRDYLPSYVAVPPAVGDIIESQDGNRYEIKEITHLAVGQSAGLRLGIGKPTGGTSPTGGGGSSKETDW